MTMQQEPDEAAGPLHAPMGDVLARVAHELSHLSTRLRSVETLVAPLIVAAATRDADLVRRIQDLDHVRQKVEGLADFLAALALVAPDPCLIDAGGAAQLVKLADLAARLTLCDEDAAPGGGWGECEMF